MSKLQENLRKLQKEGILDKILLALKKQLKKMRDDRFDKLMKQYDKETAHLFAILRDE